MMRLICMIVLLIFAKSTAVSYYKCCARGEEYTSYTSGCVSSEVDNRTLNIPVFDKIEFVKNVTYENLSMLSENWCNSGLVVLPKPEGNIYVQTDGDLLVPNEPEEFLLNEEYCIEYFTNLNNYFVSLCVPNYTIIYYHEITGMIISVFFLFLTFVIYASVPELRNLHGKALMCYVAALLVAYVFLVCIRLEKKSFSFAHCVASALILYYSLMSSFVWLNAICIDIWWTFTGPGGFRNSSKHSEQNRFLMYSAYAWGIPLLMLIITIVFQFTPNLPSYIVKPYIGTRLCWFPTNKIISYYFYGPLILVVLVNIILFTCTTYKVWRMQQDTKKNMLEDSQRHGADLEKQRYKLYLKLMLAFGINWLMEIVAWLGGGSQWFWFLTNMFNTLYGLILFVIFVCKPSVWKLIKKRYEELSVVNQSNPTTSSRMRDKGHDNFALKVLTPDTT